MQYKKSYWILILLLLPILILGLTACPPATTAEEREIEASGRTEESTIAEEKAVEAPTPTEARTAEEKEVGAPTPTEATTAEEKEVESPTPTEEAATHDADTEAPTVVSTTPPNGSQDVSPDITEISVTFSEAMMDKSWSWAYEQQDKFPQTTGDPSYDASFTINTLPVELEPNKEYEIWINTSQFKNFTDKAGNPAAPYKLMFKTK